MNVPEVTGYKEFADRNGDYEGFEMTVELPVGGGETVEALIEDDGRSGDFKVSTIDAVYKNFEVKAIWDELVEESGLTKWEYVEVVLNEAGY